jgi:hypothetical protein
MIAALCAAALFASALSIDGPPLFVDQVEHGLDALSTVCLDSYVTTHVSHVVAGLPSGVGDATAAWTATPADGYARTTVYLRYPYELWASPVEVAAYLVHEATHVYRYRIDPVTWADETAPVSTELLVRWSLSRLASSKEDAT